MPTGAAPREVGVFGGTFDPIHLGHLITGIEVLEALNLDVLTFVPARHSPHKVTSPAAPPELRLEMVQSVVEGQPRLAVTDIELRRPSPSYTVDTLRQMAGADPGAALTLILGADQWRTFGRWKEPREIAGLAKIVVLAREGDSPSEKLPDLGDGAPLDFREVPVTRVDISSSQVRERVRGGRSIRFLVADSVRRIIEGKALYR